MCSAGDGEGITHDNWHSIENAKTRLIVSTQRSHQNLFANRNLNIFGGSGRSRATGAGIDYRGMPHGATRLMREIAVTESVAAPPTDADFRAIDTVGRAEHNVMWPPDSQNKFGWLRTRWANRREESGPPSEVVQVAIN